MSDFSVNLVAGSGANRGLGSWIFSRMTRAIEEYVKENAPDINLVLTAEPDMSSKYDVYHYFHSTLAAQHQKMLHRSLITVHDLDALTPERTFQSKEKAFKEAPMISCISSRILEDLIDYGIPKKKLRHTPQGVDLDLFLPAVNIEKDRYEIVIGIVGKRYETGKKGEKFLIEIMEGLPEAKKLGSGRFKFVFIGPNWDSGPIKEWLNEDDGKTWVQIEFAGTLNEEEMAKKYSEMDGCIVTSKVQECGPMCILEAIAVGIPVVSTPCGNAFLFLNRRHKQNKDFKLGQIIAHGDTSSFIQAIISNILANVDENRKLETRTERAMAVRDPKGLFWLDKSEKDEFAPYTWDNMSKRFCDLYLELHDSLKGTVFIEDALGEREKKSIEDVFRSSAIEYLSRVYTENSLQIIDYCRSGVGLIEFPYILAKRPAIIVGAGPSLNKSIDLIREKQNEAVIFSCDAALPVLEKSGIKPNVVVVADPSNRQIKNFKEIKCNYFLTVLPTIVHPMVFHETRKSDCINIWYNMQDVNIQICKFIPKIVGKKGSLIPGVLTGGMAIQIAMYMGCWPITFVGHDLCWYDINSSGYADGVDNDKIEWQKNNKMNGHGVLIVPDIFDNKVTTEINFLSFQDWIQRFLEHENLFAYNSTGCGILYGKRIIQMDLQEWYERFGNHNDDWGILQERYNFVRNQLDQNLNPQYSEEDWDNIRFCERSPIERR